MTHSHETALHNFLDALFFESWLRFYFLEPMENNPEPDVILQIPVAIWQKIRDKYPQFVTLAAELDGRPVEFEGTRQALLNYLKAELLRLSLPSEDAQLIVSAPLLADGLEQMHVWLNMQDSFLPYLEFDAWIELFQQWKRARSPL